MLPQQPLTADSLTQRRADLLKVIGAVPKPDLPDITADEIRVESAFGGTPIRVLTYRPVKPDNPLQTIGHIHGGGFVAGDDRRPLWIPKESVQASWSDAAHHSDLIPSSIPVWRRPSF